MFYAQSTSTVISERIYKKKTTTTNKQKLARSKGKTTHYQTRQKTRITRRTLTGTVARVARSGAVDVRSQHAVEVTAHVTEADPGGGLNPVAATLHAARRPLGPLREGLRTCTELDIHTYILAHKKHTFTCALFGMNMRSY